MSFQRTMIDSKWVEFYKREANEASKRSDGADLILCWVDSIMHLNDCGERSNADTLAHIRCILQQYKKAVKATLPQEEG